MVVCCLCGVAATDVDGWIRMCSKGWARLRWYIRFVVLAGTTVLHNLQTTLVWLRVRLIISKKLPYWRTDFSSFIYNFLARCGTHFLLMKRNPADQHETIWRNQTDTVTWLAVSVSLPTLLGYQRASAFVNATKTCFATSVFFRRRIKISNVLSNTFLLISITCLSRYISLSFYRPALLWMHSTRHVWLYYWMLQTERF